MKKQCVFLLFVSLFCLSPVFGQEIVTAENYLQMVSEIYTNIRDYEAAVTLRSGNSDMVGRVSYLQPCFMRIDFSRPADQVIVFNGDALIIYLPEYRAVLNQDIKRKPGESGIGVATSQGLSLLRRNYVSSFVTGPNPEPLDSGSGERVVKLRLTRRTASEGFREIILSINPTTKLIRRVEGRTIGESELRLDFTNIRTNVGIPEARFAYDTPPQANMYNNFLFRDTN